MKVLYTYVATGQKTAMYTLRKFVELPNGTGGTLHIQNLSIDKEKALVKGREISEELGVMFIDEIDFDLNKIQRSFEQAIAPTPNTQEEFPSASETQKEAIRRIRNGDNIFLTGGGGCGKSWVVKQVTTPNTILVAPSGIAALNIGGATCHKTFMLPTSVVTEEDYRTNHKFRQMFGHGSPIQRIIIDEISMVRADYLDLIDFKLRAVRDSNKPFGGIQVVVVGDFYQLPPVLTQSDKGQYLSEGFSSRFCFTADAWSFDTVELTTVFRQSDDKQIRMLNDVRSGGDRYQKGLRAIFKHAKEYNPEGNDLHLCCFNKDASQINQLHYMKVEGKEHTYYGSTKGNWKTETPVDKVLRLKEGSRVVICANAKDGSYRNGEQGFVVGMMGSCVLVETSSGATHAVEESTWEQIKYGTEGGKVKKQVEASFTQIPLKLGWAITIHKSQGMTLDAAAIHTGRNGCFEHGQMYVALSRVKDLREISFATRLRYSDVVVAQEVKDFYQQGEDYDDEE